MRKGKTLTDEFIHIFSSGIMKFIESKFYLQTHQVHLQDKLIFLSELLN
jgi:hypothetical protein